MDKSDLLAAFKTQLEEFEKYRSFIDKARKMGDRFSPAVVEKVIRDNTEKLEGVAEAVEPLLPQVVSVLGGLESERAQVASGVEDAKLTLETLDLRLAIGEIDESSHAAESADARAAVDNAELRTAELNEELEAFRGLLTAWESYSPAPATVMPEPAPSPAPAADDLLGNLEDDDGLLGEDDAFADDDAFAGVEGRGSNVHVDHVSISDDVSSVFDDDEPLIAPSADPGDELVDLGDDVNVVPSAPMAVLVSHEGQPEEAAFPFDGEVVSLGRNRDNTIQVKNDSKVSRYHCKVYKRDGYYFIEDNKSANGTLVDGQLVTEKRLLGGEEIIVGETMFRFRIQG